jgi:hypothetical protein
MFASNSITNSVLSQDVILELQIYIQQYPASKFLKACLQRYDVDTRLVTTCIVLIILFSDFAKFTGST